MRSTSPPTSGCGAARELAMPVIATTCSSQIMVSLMLLSLSLMFTGDSAFSSCFPLIWFNRRHHCLIVLGHCRSVFPIWFWVPEALVTKWVIAAPNLDLFLSHPIPVILPNLCHGTGGPMINPFLLHP
jgi:hypothetical protein